MKLHLPNEPMNTCTFILKVRYTFWYLTNLITAYNQDPSRLYLWGDKVSMLTHIYPHKPRRKIEVNICKITSLTAHFMCGLMSDLLSCSCLYKKNMVIHGNKCPY